MKPNSGGGEVLSKQVRATIFLRHREADAKLPQLFRK
jgi:hypothetical protein